MANCNWMVTLANSYYKALTEQYGYSKCYVVEMDLKEKEGELKKLGYDFKKNSPFKNK